MDQPFHRVPYRDLLLGAALTAGMAALLHWPQESIQAAREGLRLCGNVMIPSLFPFFVLSSLAVELGLSRYLGQLLEAVMRPLFRVNGSCASALALGLLGGYPVGAKTAFALCQNGQCTKTETERLLAFCNNSGPAFILGVVGAGVFGSGTVGLLLYLIHITAALLVGLLFRFYKPKEPPTPGTAGGSTQAAAFAPAFTHCVTSGLTTVLNLCAFVLFFTVILRCLALSGVLSLIAGVLAALFAPLSLTPMRAQQLLTGCLELSSGVSALSGADERSAQIILAAFMLGWGGLSVHCQVLSLPGSSELSMQPYFVGKLLHGGLSAALTAWLLPHLPQNLLAAADLNGTTQAFAPFGFSRGLSRSVLYAWTVWLVCFLLVVRAVKKSSGKGRRHAV